MSTRPNITQSVGNAPDAEFGDLRINGTLTVGKLRTEVTTTVGEQRLVLGNLATDAETLTAEQMLSGTLVLVGNGVDANFQLTTPTAALIKAKWPNGALQNYEVLPLNIINTTAYTCTLAAGTGVTLAVGITTITTLRMGKHLLVCTNATTPTFMLHKV